MWKKPIYPDIIVRFQIFHFCPLHLYLSVHSSCAYYAWQRMYSSIQKLTNELILLEWMWKCERWVRMSRIATTTKKNMLKHVSMLKCSHINGQCAETINMTKIDLHLFVWTVNNFASICGQQWKTENELRTRKNISSKSVCSWIWHELRTNIARLWIYFMSWSLSLFYSTW